MNKEDILVAKGNEYCDMVAEGVDLLITCSCNWLFVEVLKWSLHTFASEDKHIGDQEANERLLHGYLQSLYFILWVTYNLLFR